MAETFAMSSAVYAPALSRPSLNRSRYRSNGSLCGASSSARVSDLGVRPAGIRVPGGTGRARITCWNDRRDAARKALENALGNKKETFEKWNEEIKKREAGGGGPKGRGRGWGGGGGGGSGGGGDASSDGGSSNENKWEEALQVVYAFGGLTALYLFLTQGKAMVALFMNSVLWVSRGFRRPAPRPQVVSGADGGSVADEVRRKWGADD